MSIFSENIEFMVYGGSLLVLWFSVLIVSAVETYKDAAGKLHQSRNAMTYKRGGTKSKPSPVELSGGDIAHIQSMKKKGGLSVSVPTHSHDSRQTDKHGTLSLVNNGVIGPNPETDESHNEHSDEDIAQNIVPITSITPSAAAAQGVDVNEHSTSPLTEDTINGMSS